MSRKIVILTAIIIWGATTLPLPRKASAETALTRALIQNLRNIVRLIPQNHAARPARLSDLMIPGDGLSTGRSSLAELRFNDGSLARIGEQAIFQFITKTRNLKLSNGTVLLLIPPKQGKTNVWTPNATAAIRGSALFLRYIPETKTTVVGALTNSNIEVSNQQNSQRQVLQAGQLAVLVKDRIEGLYNFDLKTFYETSDLVQGLDLSKKSGTESSDPAIAAVQAETTAAVAAQSPITGTEVIVNPSFLHRDSQASEQTQNQAQPAVGLQNNSQNPLSNNSSPNIRLSEPNSVTQFLNRGEVVSDQVRSKRLPTASEASEASPSDLPVTSQGANPANPITPAQPNPGTPATPAQPNPGNPATPAQPNPGNPATPAQPNPGNPATPAQPNPGNPATPAQPNPGGLPNLPELNSSIIPNLPQINPSNVTNPVEPNVVETPNLPKLPEPNSGNLPNLSVDPNVSGTSNTSAPSGDLTNETSINPSPNEIVGDRPQVNGNNGIGDGVGGGGVNNTGNNGNGNGGANNTGDRTRSIAPHFNIA